MEKRKSRLSYFASLIFMTLLVIGIYPKTIQADSVFKVSNTGSSTCTITGYTGTETNVVIPSEINGKRVTKIGEKAFYRKGLDSVVIPYGVTEIGSSAFYLNNITEITIPGSVSIIHSKAFMGCTKLQTVTLMYGIETIEDGAFASCTSLTSIAMADSVRSIAGNILGNRKNATVEIEANEGTIPNDFLPTGSLAPTIEKKKMNPNHRCNYEYYVDMQGNVSILAYHGQGTKIELKVPEADKFGGTEITEVGNDAFKGNVNLYKADFSGTSIKTIGTNAFAGCTGLIEVILPESVTSVGANAFEYENSALTIITDSEAVMDYIFGNDTNITFVPYTPGRTYYHELTIKAQLGGYIKTGKSGIYKAGVTIPISAVAYNGYTFVGWKMTDGTLVLPEGVTDTSRATAYTMPNSEAVLTAVFEKSNRPDWVIKDGVVLEFNLYGEMDIPEKFGQDGEDTTPLVPTTRISSSVLYYGGAPTKVIIPSTIETIETAAFCSYMCFDLKEFEVSEDNPYFSSEDGVLFNKDKTVLIQYPQAKEETSYIIPETVQEITPYAFYGCSNLKNITISSKITKISEYAFCECSKLSQVTINGNITEIGSHAFEYCTSLNEFTIPDTVTTIGTWAFFKSGLIEITIPEGITEIGYYAFSSCTALESITVEESNLNYQSMDGVLYNKAGTILVAYPAQKNNSEFTILDSVETISDGAFYLCRYLKSITYGTGLKIIGSSAFQYCSALSDICYPEECNLETIGNSAFEYCDSLIHVEIPATVTSIGANAYLDCDNIEAFNVDKESQSYMSDSAGVLFNKAGTILIKYPVASQKQTYEVPAAVEEIESYGFAYSTNLTAVRLWENVNYIDYCAFLSCTKMKVLEVRNPSADFYGNYGNYVLTGTPYDMVLRGYFYQEDNSISTVQAYAKKCGYRFMQLDSVSAGIQINQDGTVADYTGTDSEVVLPNAVIIPKSSDSILTTGAIKEFEYDDLTAMAQAMNNIVIVKKIGSHAFLEDGTEYSNITKVDYNNWMTSIEPYAFDSCNELVEAEIPASVKNIDPMAFTNCEKMERFVVDSNNTVYTTIYDGILSNKEKTIIHSVPTAYSGINGELTITGVGEIAITGIAAEAFHANTGLDTIIIKQVKYIGPGAFHNAFTNENHRVQVRMLGTDDIDDRAFAGCIGLERVEFFNYVDSDGTEVMLTRLGSNVFEGCTYLEDIYMDPFNTVYESIDGVVYTVADEDDRRSLVSYPAGKTDSSYTIESGTYEIATDAFKNALFTSIVLPDTVLYIGERAFDSCVNLESIVLQENLTTIAPYAFNACSNLKIIEIPTTVTQIGESAFLGCIGLAEMKIYNGDLDLTNTGIASEKENFMIYSVANSNVNTFALANNIAFGELQTE